MYFHFYFPLGCWVDQPRLFAFDDSKHCELCVCVRECVCVCA